MSYVREIGTASTPIARNTQQTQRSNRFDSNACAGSKTSHGGDSSRVIARVSLSLEAHARLAYCRLDGSQERASTRAR